MNPSKHIRSQYIRSQYIRRVWPSLLTVTAAVFIAIFIAGCGHKAETPAPAPMPTLTVTAVTRGTLTQKLPVSGTLQALPGREAMLSTSTPGLLQALLVRYGQFVQKGQVVAQIDTRTLQGQVQQAQATLGQNRVQVQQAEAVAVQQAAQTRAAILQAQAAVRNASAGLAGAKATLIGNEATLHNAEQSLARQRTLFAEGLVAQKDVEAAQLAVRSAAAQVDAQKQVVDGQRQTVQSQQAGVAAARAAGLQDAVKRRDIQIARQQVLNAQGLLTTARAQVTLNTLHAPLSGQVTQVGASAGETVDTTVKIVTIADLSRLQLLVSLPAAAAAQVHPSQPLSFTVDSLPGRTFQSTVQSIASKVDTLTGTVPALALVLNPGTVLKGSTLARVQIVVQEHRAALSVPQVAILTNPDTKDTSVVTVGADGTAHVVAVKTGLSVDGRVEILSGLTDAEQVAVDGQYGLPDGAKVKVQNSGPQ